MRRRLIAGILVTLLLLTSCTHPPAETPKPSPQAAVLKIVGQIGGPTQAVAVQGNYAYVGVGLRLVVLDVSNPASLREVGATGPLVWYVEDVTVVDATDFVAAGNGFYFTVFWLPWTSLTP